MTAVRKESAVPRFSIIMPTFRREHIIFNTIETIRGQTFSDWELIVVDNYGSRLQFNDGRIRLYVYTEARGAGHARNFGIGKVTGDLTVFFDDDDVMHPQYLETFDRVFRDPHVMMARCGMMTGPDRDIVNFSNATPEVVVRSEYVRPLWDDGECHDQRYYSLIESINKWTDGQVIQLADILVTARSDRQGGLRDPEGRP
jgi:glycosyltransferase involved in cell wall biosynthesis